MGTKQPRFELYKSKDGFRWRLRASNGKLIADGGEAYVSQRNLEEAVSRVIAASAIASRYDRVDEE